MCQSKAKANIDGMRKCIFIFVKKGVLQAAADKGTHYDHKELSGNCFHYDFFCLKNSEVKFYNCEKTIIVEFEK